MKKENKPAIYEVILSLLRTGEENAITTKEIINVTGLTRRELKVIISELRDDYPICSKITDGGGYWIAKTNKEIDEFNSILSKRIIANVETFSKMSRHNIIKE